MAGFRDERFASGDTLMSIAEAVQLLAQRIRPVEGVEDVVLDAALGRILAADIIARVNLPPFANSAVDGYAVRHADLAADRANTLPVLARIAAGESAAGISAAGGVVRIFTGAPMPEDADTVVMQEDVTVDGDLVTLPPAGKKGQHCRPVGEDVSAGTVILTAGRRLQPQDIGLLAAQGFAQVRVRRRLKVAVFGTGDELVMPGGTLASGQIYSSNQAAMVAMLQRFGADVDDLGILRDDPATLPAALAGAAKDHDVILTSGGVSMGEEDHVRASVEKVGRLSFWKLAIKPGKPVALGEIGTAAFVGLPGNPVAVFATFGWLVRPLLSLLGGESVAPFAGYPVRAAFDYRRKAGRREMMRVRLQGGADGMLEVVRHTNDGSAVLTSLCASDGIVEIGETQAEVVAGQTLLFRPYNMLW